MLLMVVVGVEEEEEKKKSKNKMRTMMTTMMMASNMLKKERKLDDREREEELKTLREKIDGLENKDDEVSVHTTLHFCAHLFTVLNYAHCNSRHTHCRRMCHNRSASASLALKCRAYSWSATNTKKATWNCRRRCATPKWCGRS